MYSEHYKIQFNHSIYTLEGWRQTHVRIVDKATDTVVATGFSTCNPPDPFSKADGRIRSLRSAQRHNRGVLDWGEVFNAYVNRPKGVPNPPVE